MKAIYLWDIFISFISISYFMNGKVFEITPMLDFIKLNCRDWADWIEHEITNNSLLRQKRVLQIILIDKMLAKTEKNAYVSDAKMQCNLNFKLNN